MIARSTTNPSRDIHARQISAGPRGAFGSRAVTTPESFSGDITLTADVVVIGSGAGGAVAAARFAEAGREVVILEEGEYLHTPDFSEIEGEMVPRLFAEQAMRATDGCIDVDTSGRRRWWRHHGQLDDDACVLRKKCSTSGRVSSASRDFR